jgi:hypothetical protein
MVSGHVWQQPTEEKYWPAEGQKAEKNSPYPTKDKRQNIIHSMD